MLHFFAPDYAQARQRFLAACRLAELNVASHTLVHPGPAGEALACDVARVGPMTASRLLVLTSGMHGPELMAGSAAQVGWLALGGAASLPPDTAVLLIHAINPWGAAQLRRYNEDNVDLCRNWIDFTQALPEAPAYEALHAIVNVHPGDAPAVAAADEQMRALAAAQGEPALYHALMAGQYVHADGFGFGGTQPTWSRRVMETVLAEHAAQARRVCLVDYHTGVGPYGWGSVIAMQSGPALQRVREAFGDWVIAPNAADRPAGFVPVRGHTTPGYDALLPHCEVTGLVLEHGTYSASRMLELLLDDHRASFVAREPVGADSGCRQGLRDFFYPADPHWRQAVWDRSTQMLRQAFAYLR